MTSPNQILSAEIEAALLRRLRSARLNADKPDTVWWVIAGILWVSREHGVYSTWRR